MANHDHLFVSHNLVESIPFTSRGGGEKIIPDRDSHHSVLLAQQYANAVDAFRTRKNELPEDVTKADGIYVELRVDERAQTLSSFDGIRGAHLMNVRKTEDENKKDITVFIPSRNNSWFEKKLSQYNREPANGRNRANYALINSVEKVSEANLRSFFC